MSRREGILRHFVCDHRWVGRQREHAKYAAVVAKGLRERLINAFGFAEMAIRAGYGSPFGQEAPLSRVHCRICGLSPVFGRTCRLS